MQMGSMATLPQNQGGLDFNAFTSSRPKKMNKNDPHHHNSPGFANLSSQHPSAIFDPAAVHVLQWWLVVVDHCQLMAGRHQELVVDSQVSDILTAKAEWDVPYPVVVVAGQPGDIMMFHDFSAPTFFVPACLFKDQGTWPKAATNRANWSESARKLCTCQEDNNMLPPSQQFLSSRATQLPSFVAGPMQLMADFPPQRFPSPWSASTAHPRRAQSCGKDLAGTSWATLWCSQTWLAGKSPN